MTVSLVMLIRKITAKYRSVHLPKVCSNRGLLQRNLAQPGSRRALKPPLVCASSELFQIFVLLGALLPGGVRYFVGT